jgi:hypothetical protein
MYNLNAAQFAAGKALAEAELLKNLASEFISKISDKEAAKEAYIKEAEQATDIIESTWLTTEIDAAEQQATSIEDFTNFSQNSDEYPYWQYLETTAEHPREEHLELVGNVYRIGDPESDALFPPNGWNCQCGTLPLTEDDLGERTPQNPEQALSALDKIDPAFRYNPAQQGMFPNEGHSYFEALPDANKANGKLFGITGNDVNPATRLSAKGMHHMVNILNKWRDDYETDKHGNVVFHNKRTNAKVVFTNTAFHGIQRHTAGFEQIPGVVENASEIWAQWDDPKTQKKVKRNYLKDGYCVQTVNGFVTDAFLIQDMDRWRHGIII